MRAPGTKRRPFAYVLHSVLGVKLSLFLGFVCFTGTVATVAHEVEWLYKPQIRADGAPADRDWGRMWEAARRAHPDARLHGIHTYDRSDSTYFVKSVAATDAAGEEFTVYVDPVDAEVTGHEYGRSFQDAMRALHYYLFLPGSVPFYLVTSLGFVLLASLVSGLVVYKKFWRGFFRKPQWRRNLRTWMGDLHRLAGLWSLWFVALIGLTSVWYLAEWAGVDLETAPPHAGQRSAAHAVRGDDIDRWVALAREAMPGLRITAIALPYAPGDPVVVQGQWRAWLVRERANAVYIDPDDGRLLGRRPAHAMSAGERWVHTADPLHFGTFGGLFTRLLWAVFGLLLTGLCVSGAVIHAQRLKSDLAPGGALSSLNYLGAWKWPSIVLVSLAPLIGFVFW